MHLNNIGINVSSLTLSSGRSGLFSNQDLVAVYDGTKMYCVDDLYKRAPNTIRHVVQWAEDLSTSWQDKTYVTPRVLERAFLDEQ